MINTFSTERLDVAWFNIVPDGASEELRTFVAYRTDIDAPYSVATATLDFYHDQSPILWMVETNYQHRREGLAEELWRGIEEAFGCTIRATGVSEAGEGLVAKMKAVTK